jgi:hypothetical protein
MKYYALPLPPMTEELKETLIREHPGGLCVVMAEECSADGVTAGDLVGMDFDDSLTLLEMEPPASERLQ